jgi:hypothetical protein
VLVAEVGDDLRPDDVGGPEHVAILDVVRQDRRAVEHAVEAVAREERRHRGAIADIRLHGHQPFMRDVVALDVDVHARETARE